MSDSGEKYRFKEKLHETISRFATNEKKRNRTFSGAEAKEPLEHTTRIYLLDEIVKALGWNLSLGGDILEEARIKDDTTNYVDYLGIDPDKGIPLMIIEAKAWNRPFIRGKTGNSPSSPDELLFKAIEHIKAEGKENESPVIKDWHDWLVQVRGYVCDLYNNFNHSVAKLVLTSGKWLVIFRKPLETFGGRAPLEKSDWVILQLDDFVRRSDEIFAEIARKNLVESIPARIWESQVRAFFCIEDLQGVYNTVLVKYEKSGHCDVEIFPRILLYPAVTLVRRDRKSTTVINKEYLILPFSDNPRELLSHFDEFAKISQRLLDKISDELRRELKPSGLASYPFDNFVQMCDFGVGSGSVITGELTHFLLKAPPLKCKYHCWKNCRNDGVEINQNSIERRSIEPRSYFKSGEIYHCANLNMHNKRKSRCKIGPIDEYLCCKACVLFQICWPDEKEWNLPCGAIT